MMMCLCTEWGGSALEGAHERVVMLGLIAGEPVEFMSREIGVRASPVKPTFTGSNHRLRPEGRRICGNATINRIVVREARGLKPGQTPRRRHR